MPLDRGGRPHKLAKSAVFLAAAGSKNEDGASLLQVPKRVSQTGSYLQIAASNEMTTEKQRGRGSKRNITSNQQIAVHRRDPEVQARTIGSKQPPEGRKPGHLYNGIPCESRPPKSQQGAVKPKKPLGNCAYKQRAMGNAMCICGISLWPPR
ncbi:hypothetical protein FKW77_009651 [Venturia effusa]|uniref:Uncharacterized protein n=1 Tax=Venturia effusa TaxID=50376 RepID=A0A517LA06_9PEZI|nr:hypothetical protein FKW77_009651 [Venturia effusa]